MNKNLTTSPVARNNVLNNPYALSKLESNLALGGVSFEDETLFTKGQVSEILAIDERTVDRYLSNHSDELKTSGYRILKGQTLKSLKNLYVDDMSVVDINPKSPSLGVFTFRELTAA